MKLSRRHETLFKWLLHQMGEAIMRYRLIREGDRIVVAVSGGKDSLSLLHLLLAMRARAPISFELIAVTLDQGQPGFEAEKLQAHYEALGVKYRIVQQNTFAVLQRLVPAGKTGCSLCSRLRRGILYRVARELGACSIALGHHLDDALETFFLNLFFAGRLKAMPPKLLNDAGDLLVIRPLIFARERDLERYARALQLPIVSCGVCATEERAQRQQIKAMIAAWEAASPGWIASMKAALQHVVPTHLWDEKLTAFTELQPHEPRLSEVISLTDAGQRLAPGPLKNSF